MDRQFKVRAVLLEILDHLTDTDRRRLHFLVGKDICVMIREDTSPIGTLRLFDSLFEKTLITNESFHYLIQAFDKIQCHNAARRLRCFQNNEPISSFNDDEILSDGSHSVMNPAVLNLLKGSTIQDNEPTSSFAAEQRIQTHIERSTLMNSIFKMKLSIREGVLLVLVSINLISVLLGPATTKKIICECNLPNKNALIDLYHIPMNAQWTRKGVTIAGGNGKGNDTNKLNHPMGLFVDDERTVFIADCWNHRIMQWKIGDSNGKVIAGGKGKGNGLDRLYWPTDVLMDKEKDNLIICDRENRRVVKWPRSNLTIQGKEIINNIACWGLAMDDQGYLYISDTSNHIVIKYHIEKKSKTIVAGNYHNGSALNQLNGPRYLFVDKQQTIYVSDTYNHRVMRWDQTKNTVSTGLVGVVVCSSYTEQLSHPQGLFVDKLGTIYVSDMDNSRVVRCFQNVTKYVEIAGGNGPGEGKNQFNWTRGLSFDQYGNMYVVDQRNHRVQYFPIE